METKNELNVSEVLAKLDRKSRRAKVFSFAATTLSIGFIAIITGFLAFIAINAPANRNSNANIALANTQANDLKQQLSNAKQQAQQANEKAAKSENIIKEIAKVQGSTAEPQIKNQAITSLLNKSGIKISLRDLNSEPKQPASTEPISVNTYIYIFDERQRAKAEKYAEFLKEKKFQVAIKLANNTTEPPKNILVKYFRPENRVRAAELVGALNQIGETSASTILEEPKTDSGEFEIWLPSQPPLPNIH